MADWCINYILYSKTLKTYEYTTKPFTRFLGMEYVGPSKRNWTGNVLHCFGSTGALYLILMSYLLRDWQKIELAIGIPCVAYIVFIW